MAKSISDLNGKSGKMERVFLDGWDTIVSTGMNGSRRRSTILYY